MSSAPPKSESCFVPSYISHTDIKEYMKDNIISSVNSGNRLKFSQLSRHMVSRLEHRKNLANDHKPEHEDIVATIVDHDGIPFSFTIERFQHIPSAGNPVPEVPMDQGAQAGSFLSRPMSSIDSANIGASASMPESSQDIISGPSLADDVVKALLPDYERPSNIVVLRVFEPTPDSLTLLRLGTIIEAVHDRMRFYQLIRSQCYWFALTVMGVSMLQGGRVKIFGREGAKRNSEPDWIILGRHQSSDSDLPAALGLPISEVESTPISEVILTKEDVETLTNGAGGGNKGVFPIIRVSMQQVRAIGRNAQQYHDVLYKGLVAQWSSEKSADERDAKSKEAKAKVDAKIRLAEEQAKVLMEELQKEQKVSATYRRLFEDANKRAEAAASQNEEYAKQIEDLRRGK